MNADDHAAATKKNAAKNKLSRKPQLPRKRLTRMQLLPNRKK